MNPTLIQSVQRALRLIEEVSAREEKATAKELARATGFSLSTTYHLLRTLTHEGYLLRMADGTYSLGQSIISISRKPSKTRLLARVRTIMSRIRDELKAPVYLAHFDDGEISVIEIVESPQALGIDLWVGAHESAHATALGKSILAVLNEEQRADYLSRHPLHQLTQRTVTDRRTLERQVVNEGGIGRDKGEYLPGVFCIAVPIVTESHIASVGVAQRPLSNRSLSEDMTIQTLKMGANRIARELHAVKVELITNMR